jgi:hypothetical protein
MNLVRMKSRFNILPVVMSEALIDDDLNGVVVSNADC